MSGKLITRPWTRGTTLFDTASMEFVAAASQIDINAEPGFDAVAVNTQIRTHLMLAPRQLKPKAGMSLTDGPTACRRTATRACGAYG